MQNLRAYFLTACGMVIFLCGAFNFYQAGFPIFVTYTIHPSLSSEIFQLIFGAVFFVAGWTEWQFNREDQS